MKQIANFKNHIENEALHNFYLLHGEEEYFIDHLSDLLLQKLKGTEADDVEVTEFYGMDIKFSDLIASLAQNSLFGGRKVIVLREANANKTFNSSLSDAHFERLKKTLQSIVGSDTYFIVCYKHGKINKNSKVFKLFGVNKNSVYDSNLLKDYELQSFVTYYLKEQGKSLASQPASLLLVEKVGNHLKTMVNELNKVIQATDADVIDVDAIAQIVGVHREYNFFELQKALSLHHLDKALDIFVYLGNNHARIGEISKYMALFYSFYSKVLRTAVHMKKDDLELAKVIGVSPFFVGEYRKIARTQRLSSFMQTFKALRKADAQCKGIVGTDLTPRDVFEELEVEIVK